MSELRFLCLYIKYSYPLSHLSSPPLITLKMIFPFFFFFFGLRMKSKIVEPYNKIVSRTAQLARLQVGNHVWFFIFHIVL